MTDGPYDLLIIGGGINGAGIARDACMRGLSVCLIEKEDWGWGTSAKSSMLAHGGLRYLEQFEFGLVHEALQDRELMLEQAPHLVRPLRFVYPLYPDVASRRTVRVGLWLYDILSYGKSVPKRKYWKKAQVLDMVPGLDPDGLKGGATYYDGQIHSVERLVAELVWDARRLGADCRNHTMVTELLVEGGRCTGVKARDETGIETSLHAQAVINAAGPWVDDVLGGRSRGPPKIRKTKGIHIAVPRFTETAVIVRAKDGRTFFVLPWKDHCLVGTTDTDYDGDPGEAFADAADVAYLTESARRYFPDAPLDDIRFTYAGVRPLVNQDRLTESNVTRKHVLLDHAKNDGIERLWSIQGGKITTYRSLAEEAVTQVCRTIGRSDAAKQRPTREGTLPGGPLIPWDMFREESIRTAMAAHGLPPRSAAHIVDTYGARWQQVLACDGENGHKCVTKGRPHLWCEIRWAVEQEEATHLADVMLRRTDLGLGPKGHVGIARKVAATIKPWLGWTRADVHAELVAYQAAVAVLAVPGQSD